MTAVYTCEACGLVNAFVQVPDKDTREHKCRWRKKVTAHVLVDHLRRSPDCDPGDQLSVTEIHDRHSEG